MKPQMLHFEVIEPFVAQVQLSLYIPWFPKSMFEKGKNLQKVSNLAWPVKWHVVGLLTVLFGCRGT